MYIYDDGNGVFQEKELIFCNAKFGDLGLIGTGARG